MGVQFQVDVNVTTHGAEKVNELEQKLSKMQNQSVDIKFNVQGQNQINNIIQQLQNVQSQGINLNFNNGNMTRSAQNAARQYTQNFQRQINASKLKYNIDTGKYAAASSRMSKQLGAYGNQDTANIQKATAALTSYNQALDKLQNHYNGSNVLGKKQLKQTFQDMTKAGDTFKNTLSQIRDESSKALSPTIANTSGNKVVEYMNANSKAVKKYGEELKTLEQQYRSITTVGEKSIYDKAFANLKSQISAEGLTGNSTWAETKRAVSQIAQFAGIYGMLQNTIMQIPSQAISNVKDVNAAQIELTKVSSASGTQLSQYWDQATDSAQKYGSTISDVISSTADWSRLGYNLDDAKKLSDATTLLQKVGDNMTQESSSSGLISTLKGFQMDANEVTKVVDVVNEVANTEPIDTSGIFEGLTRSASSMKAANNTFEETVALITAANSVVQDPDSVGTAFKTISMRIRGASTDMEKAGLDTEGMAESTAKLRQEVKALSGVDIMKNENEFKSTYDILDELSTKWQDLTDIQQASLTELIAGKRQGNIVSSLMTNFDVARESLKTALNDADGSGERELESWNKGIEASLSHLKAQFEDFSTSAISSDMFKGIVDGGTSLLKVLTNIAKADTKFGNLVNLPNVMAMGLGIFQGKNNSGKSTWDSPHAFFKRLMPLESLTVMCTSLFISKDSLVTFLNGVGGNAPLSCYE